MKWSFQLPDTISIDSLSQVLSDIARKDLSVDIHHNADNTSLFMVIRYKGNAIAPGISFIANDYSKKALIEQAFFEMSKIK